MPNQYMNNTILKTCYILLFSFLFFACKTVKPEETKGFKNEHFGIKGIPCIESVNPDAIDSYVGTLDCGCVTFNYDYGRYSKRGPLTRKEEFRNSFDAYHHTKFFKNRMIDPKVNKLFLDSVKVLDVRRKLDSDKLMIDCSTCNATAVLTFKNDTYLYPFTMSEKQLVEDESKVEFKEEGLFQYKYYTDSNSNPALYVTPIQNRFKKKNCLSMNIVKSECGKEKVEKIIKSVYLKAK